MPGNDIKKGPGSVAPEHRPKTVLQPDSTQPARRKQREAKVFFAVDCERSQFPQNLIRRGMFMTPKTFAQKECANRKRNNMRCWGHRADRNFTHKSATIKAFLDIRGDIK